jgi:hypothetical protein
LNKRGATVAGFIYPDCGEIVISGIGLSYRPARLLGRAVIFFR